MQIVYIFGWQDCRTLYGGKKLLSGTYRSPYLSQNMRKNHFRSLFAEHASLPCELRGYFFVICRIDSAGQTDTTLAKYHFHKNTEITIFPACFVMEFPIKKKTKRKILFNRKAPPRREPSYYYYTTPVKKIKIMFVLSQIYFLHPNTFGSKAHL